MQFFDNCAYCAPTLFFALINTIPDHIRRSVTFRQSDHFPPCLCRCGALKKLILTSNRLVTLPDTIHLISDSLELLDLRDNPDLVSLHIVHFLSPQLTGATSHG